MHPDAPARRITTWLAILGYTLVASGLPLPLGPGVASDGRVAAAGRRLSVKDRSRPFPCMDRPCGCDTADRCFTSCCCHTPAEMLAWALSRGVEPGMLAALQRRASGSSQASVTTHASAPTPRSSCCSTAAPQAETRCCATAPSGCDVEAAVMENRSEPEFRRDRQELAAPPQAATGAAVGHADEPTAEDEPSPRTRVRSVTLRALLACGGIVAEWFMAGAALP